MGSSDPGPIYDKPNKPAKLLLENIGSSKSVEITLYKTVLYGPNATGKTTVARAIEYAIKLLGGIPIDCAKLMDLITHKATEGRIALEPYEILLRKQEDLQITIKRNSQDLHAGECRGGLYSTGLHVDLNDLGIDMLVWVKYDAMKITGIGLGSEGVYNLTDLFRPSVIGRLINRSASPARIASEYNEYRTAVNHDLSIVTNGWFDLQDQLFFNDHDNYYELDYVADGIKKAALIIASKHIAERLRESGRKPIMFVESFESALHVDYVKAILDMLDKGNVPVVIETHSGYVLKYAVTNKWNAYVIEDGNAYTDLTNPELFKREREVVSELAGIL